MSDFVETVRIENFGCVRDAQLELTRLHALIGPNDSGKSTVLGALRMVGQLIRLGQDELRERVDPRGVTSTKITMSWGETEFACVRLLDFWKIEASGRNVPPGYERLLLNPVFDHTSSLARGATLVRWDPDAIRRPCELIPEGRSLTVGEKGEGLPAIYEAILSHDRAAFDEIEAGVRRHFPTVKGIWLPTTSDSKKALGVILNDGTKIHADVMSEGLLYWLAFAVLPHVDPTAILLIEEPENGLHPSRISEVMKVLRAVSSRMQVIPSGWQVTGARSWQSIRKYRAGSAKDHASHADARNVLGLVLHAYEEACEMLAFVRDDDGDELREPAILQALEAIGTLGFADEYRYELAVVGGVAKPKLEGWILCLLGVAGTDANDAGARRPRAGSHQRRTQVHDAVRRHRRDLRPADGQRFVTRMVGLRRHAVLSADRWCRLAVAAQGLQGAMITPR